MSDDLAYDDGDEITCWCGATGTYDELFSTLLPGCGGTKTLHCYCGGDFCICHNHGEAECYGCAECQDRDDHDDYDYDDDDEY